jgi:hypothetical protein
VGQAAVREREGAVYTSWGEAQISMATIEG